MSRTRFADICSLYRAKPLFCDSDRKWVEGWYVRGVVDCGDGHNEFTHMIYSDEVGAFDDNDLPVYEKCTRVDEFTIRVFTGIFLYNGLRLYEGDFVSYQGSIYVVRYDNSKGSFYLYNPACPEYDDRYYTYIADMSFSDKMSMLIVGNDEDDSIESIKKNIKIFISDKTVKGYFIELRENKGGKVFTIYDVSDREIGKYTVGDHQVIGYELCLNDMGYVNYDEFLRRKMEVEREYIPDLD